MSRPAEYQQLQKRLASGWNTWDSQSVLTQVLLPEGFAIRPELRKQDLSWEQTLEYAQIGRQEKDAEVVRVSDHALDGSYTDLTVEWRGMSVRFQSAVHHGNLLLLMTPLQQGRYPARISVVAGMLWNRPGNISLIDGHIEANLPGSTIRVYSTEVAQFDPGLPTLGPHLSFELKHPAGITTGEKLTVPEITKLIEQRRMEHERMLSTHASDADLVRVVEAAISWNTIYDPTQSRVITGLSRKWSAEWGGYVLADWDTFFASYMAGEFSRDVAYADTIEMLNEMTASGFVPNYVRAPEWMSLDRSEPPVGSWVVLELYKKFHDRWFLETVYPDLLRWNRWWQQHRTQDGYLVWGSDPVDVNLLPFPVEDPSTNTLQGAKFESGLDNLCMWDGAKFDRRTHHMLLADVGLMSLYIADSDALAQIATILGRAGEAAELSERARYYRGKVASLWSEEDGIYLDRDLSTREAWPHFSPTAFYPLLAQVASAKQADRLVAKHLLNPEEFWGEWVIPACPRNDPGYKEQDYWRGRIWGPMNFLVYLGLRNYEVPQARRELAKRSRALLMKEWNEKRHIHENFNANTGEGDDVGSSDRFYHWGALLGMISIMEQKDRSDPSGLGPVGAPKRQLPAK